MLSSKNKIIIACAGAGKTNYLVETALGLTQKKVLISTYTDENLINIRKIFIDKIGYVPANINIQSWFSFLLQEGVRPYQNHMVDVKRIRTICFQDEKTCYLRKNNYLTKSNDIYKNKVSEFAYECNKITGGLVLNRLEKIYDYIFIDEFQDFAGYDLNLLESLFNVSINIIAVGDPRQTTFSTNNSRKNKQHRKEKIYSWVKKKEQEKLISIEEIKKSYRCNQIICDFADELFCDLPKTVSKNKTITGHDGIFFISKRKTEINVYVETYKPIILRYNRTSNTLGFDAINIGLSKGNTYDRVLIFPTKPMLEYLKTRDISCVGDKSKLYVAVTRARYSVAFAVDDEILIESKIMY